MKNAVGDKGYVGRIGGDEFMVVINGANSEDEQRNILRSIKNGINSLYSIESYGFMQTTSIGCARAPLNTGDYKELFKLADYALYLAKEKESIRSYHINQRTASAYYQNMANVHKNDASYFFDKTK